jgi:uncharacterized SAM-binding protein YcdF (DUF218 family)
VTIRDKLRLPDLAVGLAIGAVAGLLVRDLDLPAAVSYPWDRTPLVPLAAALGALAWSLRLRVWLGLLAGALCLLWLSVAYGPVAQWMVEGLVRHDPEGVADAVIVLGSDLQADGEPTATAQARLLHGIEQIGRGHADRLVVTELRPPKPNHAAIATQLLRNLRLVAEVHAVGPVANTRDEAVLVAKLAAARGWRRLIVVTSPLHTRRACATFEQAGLTVAASPAVETRYDLETLDRADSRLPAFAAALHERLGMLVYRRRGWIRPDAS